MNVGQIGRVLYAVVPSLHRTVFLPEHKSLEEGRIVSDKAGQDTQDLFVLYVIFKKNVIVAYDDVARIRDLDDPVQDVSVSPFIRKFPYF